MKKPTSGIVVDGSTRGNPGPSKTQAINISNNNKIFVLDIGFSTNNITEFVGLVNAVYYAFKNNINTVYTDSQTAISWLKKGRCNSKLPKSLKTEKCIDFVSRCENLLSQYNIESDGSDVFVYNGDKKVTVEKWLTYEWGENPADFGFKK